MSFNKAKDTRRKIRVENTLWYSLIYVNPSKTA